MKPDASLPAIIAICLLSGGMAVARDGAWDEGLARAFSARLKAIEQELALLPPKLHGLPAIPVDDQGGTGGWASVHGSAEPAADKSHAVEVRWPQTAAVDWLALVPALSLAAC